MEKKEDIKLANIEHELKRLWKLHANENKLKACLFNLIIYTNDNSRARYFKDILRMIMAKFPCRVFFIHGNQDPSEVYLKIHVFSEGLMGHQSMLCDQISIEAAGPHLVRVPFLILPNLIPELPIYLLWGQDPTKEQTILPHVQKYATRLIFDSEYTEDLHSFSKMMLQRLDLSNISVMDMNWARTGGWREILAQTFDSQERIQQLAASRAIKIIYNKHSQPPFIHPETQALYLQAWLAVQLKWEYERMERKGDKLLLYYHFEGHLIQIILQPQIHKDLPPEEIIALEFSGEEDYLCTLTRKGESQVIVQCSTQYQCQLPFTLVLTNIRSARTFMQEVLYQKPSDHYTNMLRLISRIEGG